MKGNRFWVAVGAVTLVFLLWRWHKRRPVAVVDTMTMEEALK